MLSKSELRREMSDRRFAMLSGERIEASRAVLENLEFLSEFRRASGILFYLSLEEEVRTDEIIKRMIERNRRVYVPLLNGSQLLLTRIYGMEVEFEKRVFGIREPKKKYWDLCSPDRLDLVIVPGLAFDCNGSRVGFGLGYFDRFLERLEPETVFVGLAFDFQLVESVPQTTSDRKVHFVVTDKRIHDCRHSLIN